MDVIKYVFIVILLILIVAAFVLVAKMSMKLVELNKKLDEIQAMIPRKKEYVQCPSCSTKMEKGTKFCPGCGKPMMKKVE